MRREEMTDYTRLPVGDGAPGLVNAVIEIPKDSVNKYEYDKQLHVFRLDRTLYSPVHYPGDYGFIPCTLGRDGDPLDVLVLVEAPSFPGCLIQVRPIGVLRMIDQGKGDEKILADRKSTRLNSSHLGISYAVFCLKKKQTKHAPDAERDGERNNALGVTRAGVEPLHAPLAAVRAADGGAQRQLRTRSAANSSTATR